MAPFHPTTGLAVEVGPDGTLVLPVELTTDIDDPDFLATFRGAVAEAFETSEAALESRFRIQLSVKHIPPERLYPGGAPRIGEHIDRTGHLRRFPEGALVLTTGAQSTHARTGKYLQLGPHPSTRRSLAHEFAHLLGFDDAYLRAYEGSPDGPHGVVLIEWRGLTDNIMGAPDHGKVTRAMIAQLLAAYGGS